MMSANCSVVVALSRFSRPCQRVFIDQVPIVLPCQCTQMRLPSDKQSWSILALFKIRKPTRAHKHKQLPSKTHSHHCSELLVPVFETTSHARSSKHQQTTSSRPPFFVGVCPRSITPANQFRQLFSGPNQFQMHVSRALNVAQNSFQTSHVTLGRRGTRPCQRLCRIMQVETVSPEIHQDAHN